MTTLFLSDIHLSEDKPHLLQLFEKFFQEHAREAQAVYILGDLFEVWIGDDISSEFTDKVIKCLKDFTENTHIPVYIMRGNRDFLMGDEFAQKCECYLIPDPSVIDLYGEACLLMHGDSLCTKDKKHQRARKLMYNNILRKLFLSLPITWRMKLAERTREKSMARSAKLTPEIMDVTFEIIPELLRKYHTQLLIHGHTHRPNIHTSQDHDKTLTHIVLSDWRNEGNYLICHADGSKNLVYFS